MEVKCVMIQMAYNRFDYEQENPAYLYSFVTTKQHWDDMLGEELVMDDINIVSLKSGVFEIGKTYNFEQTTIQEII